MCVVSRGQIPFLLVLHNFPAKALCNSGSSGKGLVWPRETTMYVDELGGIVGVARGSISVPSCYTLPIVNRIELGFICCHDNEF